MKKWLGVLLSIAAVGLLAGCGDDDEDSGGSAQTTEQAPADTGGATGGTAAGRTVKVGMKDIQFVPKNVTVKVGDTVSWTNTDSVTHTVTKQSGPGTKFDSGNLDPGAKYEQKFNRSGKVNYVCTIHPNQTGTVTVK